MHDRLAKSDFWQLHIDAMLRDGRRPPPRNERLGLMKRGESPLQRFARRRFQQSVAGMVMVVQRGAGGASLPQEELGEV
jgi:hypothetical protein